jgi:hypothetical protein
MASFEWRFDRLQELTGRDADEVIAHRVPHSQQATAH